MLRLSLKRAQALGRGDQMAAEVELTHAVLQRRIGHLDNFRKHLGNAWNAAHHVTGDPPIAVRIALELGESHLRAGDLKSASKWFNQSTKSAQSLGDRRLSAMAEAGVARIRHARGDLRSAEAGALAAMQVFQRTVDAEGLGLALPVWADVLRHQGRFSEAIKQLSDVLPALRRQENPSPYVTVLVALANLELEVGRLGRAQECIDELAATVSTGEMLVLRLDARLAWGRILVASDQLRQAAEVLGDVCNLATSARLVTMAEHARGLLAEALWLAGKTEEARELFHRAIARVETIGDVPTLIELCRARGRVAATLVNPDALFEPIRSILSREPAELARAEWLVASALHLRASGGDDQPVWRRARQLLRELAAQLSEVDRSALRVHPWARQIRQHLDDPDTVVPGSGGF
jgi:tetratricopeptide (TPR) repeat protein